MDDGIEIDKEVAEETLWPEDLKEVEWNERIERLE